jgi:hypothetical protein
MAGSADPQRSRSRRWVMVIVAAMAITVGFALYTNLAREARKEQAHAASLSALEIVGAGGTRKFMVELARTAEETQRGLMFRQYMPEDRGMLFDFREERLVTMWMRNTYIPLDMLFIRSDGTVHHIHERAEPMNESIIESRGPVRYVLEINAGVAAKLGLKAGDRVRHAIIGK